MSENHFKSNMRDIEFNLFEFLKIQDTSLGKGDFDTMDEATARETLKGVAKISHNEIADSFVPSDREGLKFDGEGNVTLPSSLTAAMKKWHDDGWHRLEAPERLGGFGSPPSLNWANWELVLGANSSFGFYRLGAFMAELLDELATEEQKARFVPHILDKGWGGTMVLTEPDAGSDVGAGRSKAEHIKDDLYKISGVKRFITNGDYDGVENILHIVLARPEGAAPGTKGLSCFIVPKFHVNDDGSLGDRNGVYVTNVEHKMGIKASSTCELTFGEKEDAVGYLIGNNHKGIRQMFKIIEQARMCVGVKSMATLSTAYLNALDYAKERVQGPDLKEAANKSAPRVRIIEHPDVRRMLMNLKSHTEGMRALCSYTAHLQDAIRLAGGHESTEGKELNRRNDLLLPLVKGYCSDKAWPLLSDALQVYGGSGYCTDYPIEQYIRDQKIDTLYEGTTHIQSLDLIFRKIAKDGGATLQSLMGEVQSFIEAEKGGEALANERALLGRALADVQGILGALMGKMGESIYHVGLQANRVLHGLAEVVIAWLLVEHAALALEKKEGANEKDKAFYEGKIASARFFSANVLPSLTLTRKLIENGSLDVMEVNEAAF